MKVAKSLALSAMVACCINMQPACASDFVKSLLQQFSGTVVSWDDLESRHHAVEVQIRQAMQAGQYQPCRRRSFEAEAKSGLRRSDTRSGFGQTANIYPGPLICPDH